MKMVKALIISVLCLLCIQTLKAQNQTRQAHAKQDSAIFYFNKDDEMVATKNSAYYYTVILPADSSSGKILYPVKQFYMTGKPKLTTTSLNNKMGELILNGEFITYYPNGNRKLSDSMRNGSPYGNLIDYYPNGRIYTVRAQVDSKLLLVECRDSTGKLLAKNGTGEWIQYDDHFTKITGKGSITDSLQNGDWTYPIGDTAKYVCKYVSGIESPGGIGYDENGKAYPYDTPDVVPSFPGGPAAFTKFLSHKIVYPQEDEKNKITGTVIITFIIEKDGTVSNARVFRAPDDAMGNEALRAVKLSPKWNPGLQYGMPVRVMFNVPIDFSVNNFRIADPNVIHRN